MAIEHLVDDGHELSDHLVWTLRTSTDSSGVFDAFVGDPMDAIEGILSVRWLPDCPDDVPETPEGVLVGETHVTLFPDAFVAESPWTDILDSHSGDATCLYSAFFNSDGTWKTRWEELALSCQHPLGYIGYLKVEAAWRHLGIGRALVRGAMERLGRFHGTRIWSAIPGPLAPDGCPEDYWETPEREAEKESELKRLQRWWNSLGFKRTGRSPVFVSTGPLPDDPWDPSRLVQALETGQVPRAACVNRLLQ